MMKLMNLPVWTLRVLGPVMVLAVLVSLLVPVAAAEMRLLPRIVVEDDVITLADLFGDIGPVGETVVARAPDPGQRLNVSVAHLHRVVREQGLDWLPLRGLRRITVNRPGRRISATDIESVILDALAYETAGDNLSINLANRNKVFYVAMGAAADLEVESLNFDARTGRFVASIVAAFNTPDEMRVEISGRAIETVELPVLNKTVKRGGVISDGDIEWLAWQASRIPRDAVTDIADLVGLAAKRSLRPGVPVRERDVQEPVLVAKGSAVSLVYRTEFMLLTAGGQALEDGAMGNVIRVLNRKSKIVVEARVEGGNVLSVIRNTSLAMN